MITAKIYKAAQERAVEMITAAGIHISNEEKSKISVADFGLGNPAVEGAQILTFFATERVSAKIIVLFPGQTLPEHWHPTVGNDPGKEETFRVISGVLYLYIPGEENIKEGCIPQGKESCYSVRKEVVMKPGDQLTLQPGTKHWLQSGREGAVLYSFSTCVRDLLDGFTDPDIKRETQILEE